MNFTQLQNDTIKLVLLDKKYAQEILNNNIGNVRDYFIPFENLAEVNNWIEETADKIKSGDKLETVVLSNTNEFLGMVAFDNLNDKIAEIRLWLKPEIQGKGIGKASVNLLLEWFKSEYPKKQVKYNAEIGNIPSVKLAKSLGLKFNKEFVDEDGTDSVKYLLY
jgi:RimJ/RimL family protein N-acetyltransferase